MPAESGFPPSPRKIPRCKQCQQPRKGHPRSGCPSQALRLSEATHIVVEDDCELPLPNHVAAEQAERHRIRTSHKSPHLQQTHQPHASLATDSINLFETLRMPGMLADQKDSLDQRVERWRQDVSSSAGDETAPASPIVKSEDESEMSTPRKREKKSLLRTMSAEERILYLEDLKKSTKQTAQVFIMDPDDVPRALEGAKKQGFYAGTHTPAQGEEAFLVIGMDQRAVEKLLESVRSDQSSPMRRGVAGAVVGAVAMWAGLAYT